MAQQTSRVSELEATILKRARRSVRNLEPYRPKMPVGEKLRTLRKAAGLTLAAAASKAGMTREGLGSIEKGERRAGLAVLKKISKALGVSITVLVE